MAKTELDLLLEQKTIEALQYLDETGYEPDTEGYRETMKEIRENYKLITRTDVLKTEKNKDRAINICLGIAQIVVPGILYLIIGKSCLVYEETGSITSAIGRSLVNKIRPDM